jgi:DNA-binding IclR family transcriptional regulator
MPNSLRSVEKTMLALETIRRSPQPLSLMEVAAAVGLLKTSAFRLLRTLEALHYVSKSADGRYSPAPHEIMRQGLKPLERMTKELGETSSLAALFSNHMEVVAVVESPRMIRMGNATGRILPPNASALGKAIMAFQPPEVKEKLLRSYGIYLFTGNTITEEDLLQEEFARVRGLGIAEDIEESTVGGRCFAAPLLGPDGFAIGAVSLSMPVIRYRREEQRREIIEAVRETAQAMQKQLSTPQE